MTGHVSHASRTAATCSADGCPMTWDTTSSRCRNTCGAKSTQCPETTQRSPSTLTLTATSTNIAQCLTQIINTYVKFLDTSPSVTGALWSVHAGCRTDVQMSRAEIRPGSYLV